MEKKLVLEKIQKEKVIAIIRANSSEGLLDCARALAEGGLTSIELTMTTPNALRTLEKAAAAFPEFNFGLGTVTDPQTAHAGIQAGARFIVTPTVSPAVIKTCLDWDVPIFGGALTPTEILATWQCGADAVKIFPAETFGPAYLQSIRGPFPKIALLPTGGINIQNAPQFLQAGALAVAAGSSLVDNKAYDAKDWKTITARAKQFCAAVA